jgi:hypothetical protein
MADGLQIRFGIASLWTSENPVLSLAEQGFESDTGKWKWGDGATAWNSLAYQPTLAGIAAAYQPLDSDLTTIAGLTATTGNMLLSAGSAWTSANPATVKTALSLNNVDNTSNATERAATATLTNKRITPRVDTTASSATPTINTDTTDVFTITALAAAITSMTTNLSGTPTEGQKLLIRIKDNGTARAITWGASFGSSGVATLLATTAISKTHHVGLVWDGSVWRCLAVDAVGY